MKHQTGRHIEALKIQAAPALAASPPPLTDRPSRPFNGPTYRRQIITAATRTASLWPHQRRLVAHRFAKPPACTITPAAMAPRRYGDIHACRVPTNFCMLVTAAAHLAAVATDRRGHRWLGRDGDGSATSQSDNEQEEKEATHNDSEMNNEITSEASTQVNIASIGIPASRSNPVIQSNT